MIVTITTFNLAQPTTLDEITKTFQVTAPKYQGVAGLLGRTIDERGRSPRRRHLCLGNARRRRPASHRRVEENRRKAIRHGAPNRYLRSPVMVDNRDGSIKVAA